MDKTDVSQIDDLPTLKAMAYDFIATKEQAENNLRIVNARILELLKGSVDTPVSQELLKVPEDIEEAEPVVKE